MDENEAVKKVASAAAAIAEGISRAFPEPVRSELREWQRQQDAAFEAHDHEAKRSLERFRSNRGDRQWRR